MTAERKITCESLEEALATMVLDGTELDAEARAHVDGCALCSAVVAELTGTLEARQRVSGISGGQESRQGASLAAGPEPSEGPRVAGEPEGEDRKLAGEAPGSETPDQARVEAHVESLWSGVDAALEKRGMYSHGGTREPAWYRDWRWLTLVPVGAAAALLLVLGRGLLVEAPPESVARIVATLGETWLGGERRIAAAVGTKLSEGSAMETGPDGRVALTLAGSRAVTLGGTRLSLAELSSHRVNLALGVGTVLLDVERSARAPQAWQVTTPRMVVEVVGTIFDVSHGPDFDETSVWRGKVRVTTISGDVHFVGAGERLRITDRGVVRHATETEMSEPLALLDPAQWRHAEVARAEAFEPDSVGVKSEPVGATRPGREKRRRATEDPLASVLARIAQRDCQGAGRAVAAIARNTPRSVEAQGWVLVAQCYEGDKQQQEALRLYRRVARSHADTEAGANALYEVGRMERDRGEGAAALAAFERYVVAHPRAPLASEALYRTCLLHAEASRADVAQSCLARYRRSFPGGKRVVESWLTEATLERVGRKNCRRAVVAYERYLDLAGPEAAEARRWLSWCREHMSE